jgi:hypothetical protein
MWARLFSTDSIPEMAVRRGAEVPWRPFPRGTIEALEFSFVMASSFLRPLGRKPQLHRDAPSIERAGLISFVVRKPTANERGSR